MGPEEEDHIDGVGPTTTPTSNSKARHVPADLEAKRTSSTGPVAQVAELQEVAVLKLHPGEAGCWLACSSHPAIWAARTDRVQSHIS